MRELKRKRIARTFSLPDHEKPKKKTVREDLYWRARDIIAVKNDKGILYILQSC